MNEYGRNQQQLAERRFPGGVWHAVVILLPLYFSAKGMSPSSELASGCARNMIPNLIGKLLMSAYLMGACITPLVLFGFRLIGTSRRESYMHEILNEVYLQNLSTDECNFSRQI